MCVKIWHEGAAFGPTHHNLDDKTTFICNLYVARMKLVGMAALWDIAFITGHVRGICLIASQSAASQQH